jgi:hypothetical protein
MKRLSSRALLLAASALSLVGRGLSLAAELLGSPSRCASCWHEADVLTDVPEVGLVCEDCASLVDPLGSCLRRGR